MRRSTPVISNGSPSTEEADIDAISPTCASAASTADPERHHPNQRRESKPAVITYSRSLSFLYYRGRPTMIELHSREPEVCPGLPVSAIATVAEADAAINIIERDLARITEQLGDAHAAAEAGKPV